MGRCGAEGGPVRRPPRALTLSELWAFIAVALPVVALLLPKLSTIDLAYQIRAGDLMLDSHRILSSDPFTFTVAGRSWLNQQWGTEILLALVYRAGGWPLLVVVRAAVAGALAWLVFLTCRHRGAETKLAAVLSLASFALVLPGLILRPQLLGLALFGVVMWMVAARHTRPGLLWAVPAVVALWANVHGSFFLGPLLAGLAFLEDLEGRRPEASRAAGVALASAVAANLNPFGFRVWGYVLGVSANPEVANSIVEWRPPTLRTAPGALFFLSAMATIALLAHRGRLVPWTSLLTLGLFFAIGLYAARGMYWWGLVAPPTLAPELRGLVAPRRPEPPLQLNNAIAAVLAVLGLAFLPWWRTAGPQGSLDLLDHAPPGVTLTLGTTLGPADRMFNPQLWGSWFEWVLPESPTFVDARIELFPEEVWNDYDAVSGGREGWTDILDRWGVTVVVAEPRQQARLIPLIRRDPGWHVAYEGRDGLVLVRT